MSNKMFLGIPLMVLLFTTSCEDKEKKKLQTLNDSLRNELKVSQQTTAQLEEVGSLLDSIDANRQLLRTDVVEGTSYKDYQKRLVSINTHIKETQAKIAQLEESAKKTNTTNLAMIRRLKNELSLSTQQITALQQEIEKIRGENENLTANLSKRDSLLALNSETIKMREQDIASLETQVREVNATSQQTQADLYFAQAEALEQAAERTKFAPRKKKETKREALELYKLSRSLGKEEAQSKIDELEKELG